MEIIRFKHDIKVLYVTARSFPAGIMEAHQKLHSLVPFSTARKYFGISRPENGGDIVYRAGAEEQAEGEAEQLGCPTLVLKKGNYVNEIVEDYARNIHSIDATFDYLLEHPEADPQGYCVEWYFNDKDVRCMVRLDQ
jgi:hypothetical protein